MRILVSLFCFLLLPAGAGALEEGDMAPDFTLPTLDGTGTVSLSDYRGKVVYLDFWASWCPPCLVSIPLVNDLRNQYTDRDAPFEVLAVNVDTEPQDGRDFLQQDLEEPVDYVLLSDPDGETPARYEIQGMPSSFLIDAEGRVRMTHQGFKRSDIELIENRLDPLLEAME